MERVGLRLPESRVAEFKVHLGDRLHDHEVLDLDAPILVTVGDVVSVTLVSKGIVPDVCIYDGMTERKEMKGFNPLLEGLDHERVSVVNMAGTISVGLIDAVKDALENPPKAIFVDGEEDLALMPVVLLAPNGTKVVYGWPGVGMMVVTVSEEMKGRMKQLIGKMEVLQ